MSAKIRKTLIVLLIVMVLLIGALAALLIIPKLGSKESEEGPVLTVTDPVKVAFGPDVRISEYVIEDGTWYYADDPTWPIKQNGVTRILDTLPKVIPAKRMAAADDLSAYGLDEPGMTLTLTGADGTLQSLYIGNAASDKGNYAKTSMSDDILVLSTDTNIVSFLASSINDMMDTDPPSSFNEVTVFGLTVSGGGKTAAFVQQQEDEWRYMGPDGKYVAEEDYSAVGSDGESHTVRKYLNDVGDVISSFKSNGNVDYGCTEEELASYGLDDPITVTVQKTDDTVIVYLIGSRFTDSNGSDYYYFTTEGSPAVFRMSADTVTPFIELLTVLGN